MKDCVTRHFGEYCSTKCGNKRCLVNAKNKKKGEHVTLVDFLATNLCNGYVRPRFCIKKTKPTVCPLCGGTYHGRPALSRTDNRTRICPDCGTRQAMAALGADPAEQERVVAAIRERTQEA